MSNTIIPSLIRFGINALTRNGGDPVKAVQDTVNTVRESVDTFVAYSQAQGGEGSALRAYPGAPAGETLAHALKDINIGVEGQTRDPVGPNDRAPHGVEIVQRFLERSGYLDLEQGEYGTYDSHTEQAVEQFQRDNGLSVTGVVDNATLSAMMHPRPRVGYGAPTTNGHLDLNRGTVTLQQPDFPGAASFYREQLGRPTSAAMRRLDGSTVQTFERGSLVMDPQGQLRILNTQGSNMFTQPDYAAMKEKAVNHSINQLNGDNDGSNQNCGYASANMGLSFLGVQGWSLEGVSEKAGYESTMMLRELGQPGTNDKANSEPGGILQALSTPEMQAAGVQAERWDNDWNAQREPDVERMRLAFMNGDNPTAFVVAGNPDLGWGSETALNGQYWGNDVYNGEHFISVVGYNPATDKFLVLDPMALQPIEVSSQQMADYMEDPKGVTHGEVIQLTYHPPESPAQP